MDKLHRLSRGKGLQLRSREGAPSLIVSYNRDAQPATDRISKPNEHADLTVRQVDRDYNEPISRFSSLPTSVNKQVRRKSGKRGVPTLLRVNVFKLNFPDDLVLYDYKVKIEPDVPAEDAETRRSLLYLFERSMELAPFIRGIVHDGAYRLISNISLPPNFASAILFFEDGGRLEPKAIRKDYIVRLLDPKELKSADLARYLRGEDPHYCPQPIISAFNLILTSYAAQAAVRTGVKRTYSYSPISFNPPEDSMLLSASLEAWKGFAATIVPTYKSLMVSISASLSVFRVPYDRLSDGIIAFTNKTHQAPDALMFYSHIRVITTYLGYRRRSKVKGFGPASASMTNIFVEGLGEVTVEQYLQRKFGISLEHADDLPVVNIGTEDNASFIPAELCRIEPGQSYAGPLSRSGNSVLANRSTQMTRGIKEAATMQGLRMLGLCHNGHPMTNFGIKVSFDIMHISARVLPCPKVLYETGEVPVTNGCWSAHGTRFAKPAQITGLSVLVVHDGDAGNYHVKTDFRLRHLIMNFITKCRSFGMKLDTALPPVHVLTLPRQNSKDPLRTEALCEIGQALKSLPVKPSVLLAFLLSKSLHVYAGLRTLCDVQLGIHCLCASAPNILEENGRNRHLTSLALKLNTKLGGVNHTLDRASLRWLTNTMVVGMDVVHPDAGFLKGIPSIAAVVASYDMDFVHYLASLSIQERNKEAILNVKHMMIERLKDYRQHMKDLPERIVVFRGSVSDGQVKAVLDSDVSGIRDAFGVFNDYKPKLTYIICNKSHRIRFDPVEEGDATTPRQIKAGTVVDKGITGIYNFSFYLHTQAATQDSAHATRYTVLIDESKFSADDLQQGINNLSYLWAPASRSVSLVPPAYWAKRACKRGKLYLQAIARPAEGSENSAPVEERVAGEAREAWGKGIHANVKSTMFYM